MSNAHSQFAPIPPKNSATNEDCESVSVVSPVPRVDTMPEETDEELAVEKARIRVVLAILLNILTIISTLT